MLLHLLCNQFTRGLDVATNNLLFNEVNERLIYSGFGLSKQNTIAVVHQFLNCSKMHCFDKMRRKTQNQIKKKSIKTTPIIDFNECTGNFLSSSHSLYQKRKRTVKLWNGKHFYPLNYCCHSIVVSDHSRIYYTNISWMSFFCCLFFYWW